MPIYAYRCETCGFAKDVLQKMSDPLLVDCPSCGAPTFKKQVTAAGFQLKGSGWYVTDFRNGQKEPPKAAKPDAAADGAPGSGDAPSPAKVEPATGTPAAPAAGAAPAAARAPATKAAAPPPAGGD